MATATERQTATFTVDTVSIGRGSIRTVRLEVKTPDPDDYDDAGFERAYDEMQGFDFGRNEVVVNTDLDLYPGDTIRLTLERL